MELTYKLEELPQVALTVLPQLKDKVVCFHGDMGSGKTTFIKALVAALGSSDPVSSPTFSIVNEYKTATDTIYHFDLYRVKNLDEVFNFGMEDYLNSGAWIFIEWPEVAAEILPEYRHKLLFTVGKVNERSLKLTKNYCKT